MCADTATIYKNESVIGNFLVEHKARERVFLTTKISPYELGSEEKVYQAAIDSLTRLQTNCVDLLLIHWPGKHGVKTNTPENEGHRLSACAYNFTLNWKHIAKV
jgi:diketogulonate reductase-like aldo/keto reductase